MTRGGPLLILGVKSQGQLWTSNVLQFLHDFPFDLQWWYLTHVLPMTGARLLLILGSKCQRTRSNFTLKFASFLHNNSITFWHTMMILHTCVDHGIKRTSIDFGLNRSKLKVKFGLETLYRFNTITPLPFDIQWWYFTHALIMTQRGPLLILGSIGQSSRSNLDLKLCTVSTQWLHYLVTYNNDTSHMN